jgi:hypothetical protein
MCSTGESGPPVLTDRSGPATAAFVELPLLLPPGGSEWTVEFERASGTRMRVHLLGGSASDFASLARLFWSAEP